jgi:chemosensory pili system protein ChpA (sensor histidine kinase/response regulator)
MSGYQIDEVRELFTTDMDRFMGDLETRARELGEELTVIQQRTKGVESAHNSLAVSFHAIAGTSALLSVGSSHTLASHLEALVRTIDTSVRALISEAERLSMFRQACDVGIGALREVIAEELRGDRPTATRHAAAAIERVVAVMTPQEPASTSSIARSASGSSGADADAEQRELLEVFRDELRTAMAEARTQLDELERGPDRGSALSRLRSILHMMKGSAASVGEAALAIELRSVYEVIEDFLDRGEVPDAAATRRIRADLAACEPTPAKPEEVDLGWDAPADAEAADLVDPQDVFRAEAQDLLRQGRARLDELTRDPVAARDDLARIFHRLKGSALVVGLSELGSYAAELERVARQQGPLDAGQLDRLSAMLAQPSDARPEATHQSDAGSGGDRVRPTREAVPQRVTGELWESFLEESGELLDTIERAARDLERTRDLPGTVTSLLGSFHTLKGAANTVGLTPVGRELHVVETMLESLRAAPSPKRRGFVLTRLFDVLERLRRNLRQASRGDVECAAEVLEQDIARMANLDAHSVETPSGHSWLPTHDSAWSERHVGPPPRRGEAVGSSREHAQEAGSDRATPASSGTAKPAGGERRFIRVPAERLDALMDMVGELIVARSRVQAGLASLNGLQEAQHGRRQRLLQIVDTFTEQAEFANLGGTAQRGRRGLALPMPTSLSALAPSSAPAPTSPLADFGALEFDVYEEVHVLARRLAEASSDINDTAAEIAEGMSLLADSTEELGGIVSTLQVQINRARMVALEALFSRLALPVRDTAERERKLVEVGFVGAEVVVDKAISDALYAPMLHLVRNAVFHGIESPKRRRASGKPEIGRITLEARQEAGEIVISIADDGAGLDLAALHRAGVARGAIGDDVPLDAPEVLDLVFAAGLSTSAETNDVAGRGMGGDVVRRTVQRLGGSVRAENRPGQGVTFFLRLPVTLAITRAIVIRQGERLFGIPLLFVERILRREDLQELHAGGLRQIRHGDDLLGVVRILPGDNADRVFLICSVGGRRLAIEADAVVAHDEVVVKPLGEVLDGHPLFAGASQRGDGELALILDMQGVAEAYTAAQRPAPARRERGAADPTQAATVILPNGPATSNGVPAPGAPSSPVAGAAPGASKRPAAPAAAPAPPRLRVLFVDDSLSVRKVAENTLRKLGVTVITATDGRDALDRLRDEQVEIVFTDLEMPRMHGYELIQEMRYIAAYRSIPIVVVSSRSGDKHVQKALEAGANEYLTKPFSAETLSGALQKLLPAFRLEGST